MKFYPRSAGYAAICQREKTSTRSAAQVYRFWPVYPTEVIKFKRRYLDRPASRGYVPVGHRYSVPNSWQDIIKRSARIAEYSSEQVVERVNSPCRSASLLSDCTEIIIGAVCYYERRATGHGGGAWPTVEEGAGGRRLLSRQGCMGHALARSCAAACAIFICHRLTRRFETAYPLPLVSPVLSRTELCAPAAKSRPDVTERMARAICDGITRMKMGRTGQSWSRGESF